MNEQPIQRTSVNLSDSEQRLFALAAEDTSLAELAVRLEVDPGQASDMLQALCARLDVPDRNALRRVTFDPPPGESPAHPAALFSRRISRRTMLAGATGLGLAAAGGVAAAVLLTNQSSSGTKPVPGASRTASSTPSPTQSAFDAVRPSDPANWQSRSFAPGEEIDWDAGMFFLRVDTGAVEAWRFSLPSQPATAAFLGSFFGGDLVIAQFQNTVYAIDRTTRAAWQWPGSTLFLSDRVGGYYLFRLVSRGVGVAADTPIYVANDRLALQSAFTVDTRGGPVEFVASPDGHRVAYVDGGADGSPFQLHLRDLSTGKSIAEHTLEAPGPGGVIVNIASARADNVVVVSLSESPVDAQGTPVASPPSTRLTAPWSGKWTALRQVEGPPISAVSPDGRSESRVAVMLSQIGEGGFYWPATVVSDLGGSQRFALLSVSPPVNVAPNASWLADSSALVVMNLAGKESGAFWDNYTYSLLNPASGLLKPLSVPANVAPASSQSALYAYAPSPSPVDPAIIALGPTAAFNLATGKLVRANLGQRQPPILQSPWVGRPNEIAWELPVPGRGGPQVPFLIQPRLIHGSLPVSPFKFVVARTGECLNLRASPSLDAEVLACLSDGTPLTMAEWTQPKIAPYVPYTGDQNGAWVYVSTQDRLKGWASAYFLDWS